MGRNLEEFILKNCEKAINCHEIQAFLSAGDTHLLQTAVQL